MLSGGVNAELAVPVLEKAFGSWRPSPLPEPPPGEVLPLKGRQFQKLRSPGAEALAIAWRTVPAGHRDEPSLRVLAELLGHENTGVLQPSIENLAIDATANLVSMREAGYLQIQATALEGRTLEELEGAVLQVVHRLRTGDISAEELQAIQMSLEIDHKYDLESAWGRAAKILGSYIAQRSWSDQITYDQREHSLTAKEIADVAQRYLADNFVVVFRRNGKREPLKLTPPKITPVELGAPQWSKFAEHIRSISAQPVSPDWLETSLFQSDSQLVTVSNTRNDLYELTYSFPLSAGQSGPFCLAFAALELSGSQKRERAVLKRDLQLLGVEVETKCEADLAEITLYGLDRTMEATLRIVHTWLTSPSFSNESLTELQGVLTTRRIEEKASIDSLVAAMESYLLWGEHSPFLTRPKQEELRSISEAGLQQGFHNLLSIRPDIRYFGPREAAALPELALAPIIQHDGEHTPLRRSFNLETQPRIYFLHAPGERATVSMVSTARSPLSVSLAGLYGELVDGGMGALVFQRLRESSGLSYDVGTEYRHGRTASDSPAILGYLSAQPENLVEATSILAATIRLDSVAPARLTHAKHNLREKLRSERISPRDVGVRLQQWRNRGHSADPRKEIFESIESVSLGDLQQFARLHQLTAIAVVGDRERIDLGALRTMGRVIEISISDIYND